MILRQLHPGPYTEFDADTDEGRSSLDSLYAVPHKRWLRINLIASVNGSAAGPDGTSDSLTNRADRRILGTIRRHSDAVLVGATSVRAEGYLLPKTSRLAILTGSGDLTGHKIPHTIPEGKVVVLCPTSAVTMVRSTLIVPNVTIVELDSVVSAPAQQSPREAGAVNLIDVVWALRNLGLERIVCEGGPTLAGQLISMGLVDELCLSICPQLSAATTPVLPGLNSSQPLHLDQLLADPDHYLFARWRVLAEPQRSRPESH